MSDERAGSLNKACSDYRCGHSLAISERRGAIRLLPLLFSSRRIGDTIVGQLELAPVQLPTSLWSQLRSRRLGDTRRGRFLPAGVKSAGRALADPPPNKSVPAIPFPKLVQQRLPALPLPAATGNHQTINHDSF